MSFAAPASLAIVVALLMVSGSAARQQATRAERASAVESFRRTLSQETSDDAPGPFPQPDVAAGSPYTDQQQIIQDTSATPFSAVGQLLIYGTPGTLGICTGSLISPGVVLTAAHCWYDDGEASTSAYFTPGYSAAAYPHRPHGTAEVVAAKLPTAYTTCNSTSYVECSSLSDYAVFFLNRTFDDVDAISYGYSTTIPETQTVYTAGYPGDKCNSDSTYTGQCPMWYTACPMTNYDDADVFETTRCFSGPGQSGSPVWISTEPGKALQVAILTSTPVDDDRVAYDGETPTLNVVITPSRYEQIQKWVASGPDGRDEDTALFPATSPKPSS